ncbi:hypothetical protein F2P56_014679 [Juglans regia]|uniref:Uncharacterized protein n=2 Tax=Juglans regia TaxID=51240 RepID=A0A833XDM3_JUGRE|nr:uncharacterized protein LOC109006168 [Juglans regia]KAF5464611.1 hypothetical protein F2P56_014679 [Juglans regia]
MESNTGKSLKGKDYKFLVGLNKDLDEVQGRIVGLKPLPSIQEAFSKVRMEESRKKVKLGPPTTAHNPKGSALSVQGPHYQARDNRPRKGWPWCDHCRKTGHTKETCWKIHGKPADWKPSRPLNNRESRGHLASYDENHAQPEQSLFRKEQMELLQELINQQQSSNTSVIGTGSLAHKGLEFGEDDWQCQDVLRALYPQGW